jgi:glutathione synthase/RimK-type ligase-like ATP-grasp enzyme
MFTQNNSQTQIDFRKYCYKRPSRSVPYRLPEAVEFRLHELMKVLQLKTGSIDLVRTTDGRYVFLEVNPVGQFGMVSGPCNYHLERKVAELLVERHNITS